MYDTISIMLNAEKKELEKKVEFSENTNLKTGEVNGIKGRFKNFNVYHNIRGFILKGSLAKFNFDGSNLETLSRQGTQRALERLADELCLNIQENQLFRFDVGTNFIMKKDIENYLCLLGDLTHFQKSNFKESIYYDNYAKHLIFYDKIKDLKKKRVFIPDEYMKYAGRLLRYECRFTQRINKQFQRDCIKVRDLYDEDFYIMALDRWKDFYFSINKLRKIKFKIMALTDVRTFQAQLMLLGLKSLGLDEALRMIELDKHKLGRMQYKRLKDKIKKLSSSKELTEPNNSMIELDEKVRQAVANYR